MKRIGLTQRVDVVADYGERRDCLDQRWYDFIRQLGCLPIPLPNISGTEVVSYLDSAGLDGVIFTGGNSLASLETDAADAAPERDVFEAALLNEVLIREIPVVGVCRGMQFVNVELGGELRAIDGHVAQRHTLRTDTEWKLAESVNSFHHWGIPPAGLAVGLSAVATDTEGNIEAFCSETQKILGLMWHPERQTPFCSHDIQLIKRHLK